MKTVKELIEEYDSLQLPDKEKEQWLITTCNEYENEFPDDTVGISALYNELGSFYKHRNMLDQGETAFLKAAGILEADYSDSVNYSTTLNNLAGLYRLKAEYETAEELFCRSENILISNQIESGELLAACENNLALVYIDQQKYEDAEKCMKKALEYIKADQNEGYELAATYGNLGVVLSRLGRKQEALNYYQEAADIFERIFGREDIHYRGIQNQINLLKS